MNALIFEVNPIMKRGMVSLLRENNIKSQEAKSLRALSQLDNEMHVVLINEHIVISKLEWLKTECLGKLNCQFVCLLNEPNIERYKNLIQLGFSGVILNKDASDLLCCIKWLENHTVYVQQEYLSLFINPRISNGIEQTGYFNSREEAILRLMFDEYSTKEIGSKLALSSRTVEWHRKRMMEKVGAKNMIVLIRYGLEKKLLVF